MNRLLETKASTRLEGDRSVFVWRWTFSKRFLSFPFSFSFWNVHFFFFFSIVKVLQLDAGFHRQAGHRVETTAGCSLRAEAEGFSHTGSFTATARASWCSIFPPFSPLFCFPLKSTQIFFFWVGLRNQRDLKKQSFRVLFQVSDLTWREAILNITMVFWFLKNLLSLRLLFTYTVTLHWCAKAQESLKEKRNCISVLSDKSKI